MCEKRSWSVVWYVEVEANDALEATREARDIMQHANDPDYIANSFGACVNDEYSMLSFPIDMKWIDLDKIEGRI
jgi:hypothetical protein